MPKPVVSLFGFHGQEQALEYLQKLCLVDDSSPEALLQHFQNAQSRLGSAIERAGYPEVLDIPGEYRSYCDAVLSSPGAKALESFGPVSIRLVEIAPLLAFQHHIELDRAESLYRSIGKVPEVGDMLPTCLPIGPQSLSLEQPHQQSPGSWMIRTPSWNVRIDQGGLLPLANGEIYFGVRIAMASPFVWVVEYEGLSYLNNGYHRGYSLGKANAKYMPCVLQKVSSLDAITSPPFPIELLRSANPPTLGHYIYERAYPLQLRNYKRYLHITYAEHLFFEE